MKSILKSVDKKLYVYIYIDSTLIWPAWVVESSAAFT